MPDESRFVLRVDHIEDIGKLTGKIKDIDSKHMQLHSDLKVIITGLSNSTNALTETSKGTNKILERIDDKLDGYNDRIKDVEYNVETTSKRIDGIEHSVSERKKGNAQIIVAIITALATILGGASWLAQLF